jgi:hypothetical protein
MSNNIPFIYNYCDRWCERCCFTSRCAVYEDIKQEDEEEKDLNNQVFWDKLSKSFEKAMELLHQGAIDHGMDLNSVSKEDEEEIERHEQEIDRLVEEHPLKKLCKQYSTFAHRMVNDEAYWKMKADEIKKQAMLGIFNEDQVIEEVRRVKDCQEVIVWHMDFIWLKFTRALSAKMDGYEDPDEIQADSNGSAKIALVAVDHSLQAWLQLLDLMPDEDRIMTLLSILSKIDKMGRLEFPKATQFIRPGFDEQ